MYEISSFLRDVIVAVFRCPLLGYDPALVNPYLPKVLENLGALVYEDIENEGQICFNITSVFSSHGEQLMLKQVTAAKKTVKFLGGKSANELTHSLLNFEFFNPCCTKSIQYTRLILTGRVNRTMTFQYSELIYLQLHQKLNCLC